MEDKDESIISHIEALRQMLLRCLRAIGIVVIPLLLISPKCLDFFIKLILRGNDNIALNYFSPAEVFIIQIKFALVLDIIICFPYIAKQVWDFCVPALYEHEKKFIKSIVFTSSMLFIIGSLFCLFVILPLIINFGMSFSTSNIQAVLGISNVVNLALWLILAFGVMFQLPLVTHALIKSDIVSYETIKNSRPYVIVGLLIIAGILTPPDVVSQVMLFLPTYLLFEIGLLFSRKKKDE
ncbi:MAG: twin-arginine translocase subunit TatC [Candidatus Gastranaerophilaceae bacterium]